MIISWMLSHYWEKAESELGKLGVGTGTEVLGLLQAHMKDLRYRLVESLSIKLLAYTFTC